MLHFKRPTTGEVFAYDTQNERDQWGASDLVAMTTAEVEAHKNPPPTQGQIIARFTAQIQARLDDFAKTRNYDGILSACTYASSAVAKFQAEGQYCVQARDATWAAAYQILEKALAGNWPSAGASQIPASISDIEADLPPLVWPAA